MLLPKWTEIYARFLALILIYGAVVHLANIFSLTGNPWQETPVLWQISDVVLLVFNLVTAWALWHKTLGGIISFIIGIVLLQIIPYTVFREYFIQVPEDIATLNGLIVSEMLLIVILLSLITIRK